MVLSTFVLVIASSFPMQSTPPNLHQGIPPTDLWGTEKGGRLIEFGPHRGGVRYNTLAKRVSVEWSQSNPFSVFAQPRGTQELTLSYHPTEIVRSADNKVCVAGKRRNGFTVIQEITFEPPVLSSDLDGNLNLNSSISSIETIYDAGVEGRDMVRHMFRSLGSDPELYVQFWDSSDIYTVNLNSGTTTLEFAASQPTGVPFDEHLADNLYSSFGGRDHPTMGFMYGFTLGSETESGSLLLLDGDRDGALDSSMFLTDQDWADMNLSDDSIYLDNNYLP